MRGRLLMRAAAALLCSLGLGALGATGALAQSSSVFVDPVVLESLGSQQTVADVLLPMEARPLSQRPQAMRSQGGRGSQNGALPPPRTAPKSQLMVAPVGGSIAAPRVTATAHPQKSKPPAAPRPPKAAPSHYSPSVTVTAPAPEAPVAAEKAPVASVPQRYSQAPEAAPPSAPPAAPPREEAPEVASVTPAAPKITPPAVPLRQDDAKAPAKDPVAAAAMAAAAARASNPAPPTAPPVATTLASVAKPPKLPPAAAASLPTGEGLSIPFASDDATIPPQSNSSLEGLVQRMAQDPSAIARIEAYAAGGDASVSKARRLSLSRALAIRSFLLDRGVAATRIEVRALGTPGKGNPDRVDVGIIKS